MKRIRLLVPAAILGLFLSLVATVPAASAASGLADAQRRLNELRCDAGVADGAWGPHTSTAVWRFQSRHGLSRTGQLDSATRSRLFAGSAMRCDRRPVPGASGKGKRIVISQWRNWIWLVRADGTVRAQGGIADNSRELSPGAYRTGSYCGRAAKINPNLDYDENLLLDHFVRFAPCGFGMHRIPRPRSGGGQIHPDWYLGTDLKASHGCIRLSAAMARNVWDFSGSGVPVHVVP